MTRLPGGLACALLAGALMVPTTPAGAATRAPGTAPATASTTAKITGRDRLGRDTRSFRGVNWADPRDNYASDDVVPSGLSRTDGYRATYRTASRIVGDLDRELDANTVRLPINPATVDGAWWRGYRGAIDAALDRGDTVILGYWEAPDAKDGRIDDVAAWNRMWDRVVRDYRSNDRVYFEPMNEPFGYTLDEWVGVTTGWLARHPRVPRHRVVISGTGYNDDVTGVGATPALDGTLLSLHFYGFWADDTTESAWLANLRPRIGRYGWRTIVDEAGSPMTTGLDDARHGDSASGHDGDVSTAYLGALTQVTRNRRMGLVYWPGLRTGDSYSMTTLQRNGHLRVNNASGLAQLQWGWGLLRREP